MRRFRYAPVSVCLLENLSALGRCLAARRCVLLRWVNISGACLLCQQRRLFLWAISVLINTYANTYLFDRASPRRG